ncbi:hypothetical protein R1flu_001358 [Riccia fluitans]|uniref:Uncharacterized protein n=1 Tax=Riccia fluitans TaxID=41844 RepID=A0ABD1Y3A5_9MARC
MAMACALSCSLSSLSITAVSSSSVVCSANSSLQGLRLAGVRLRVAAPLKVVFHEKRNVIVKAAAEEAASPAAPADPVSSLKLESEILKKKAKKEELRRKRLELNSGSAMALYSEFAALSCCVMLWEVSGSRPIL